MRESYGGCITVKRMGPMISNCNATSTRSEISGMSIRSPDANDAAGPLIPSHLDHFSVLQIPFQTQSSNCMPNHPFLPLPSVYIPLHLPCLHLLSLAPLSLPLTPPFLTPQTISQIQPWLSFPLPPSLDSASMAPPPQASAAPRHASPSGE